MQATQQLTVDRRLRPIAKANLAGPCMPILTDARCQHHALGAGRHAIIPVNSSRAFRDLTRVINTLGEPDVFRT